MVAPTSSGATRTITAGRARIPQGIPDLTVTLEDVFAAGDRVAVRGIDRGTHQGEFMGRAATGRPMTATWIEIFRIQSGKAVGAGWKQTCGDCWT